MMGDRAYDSDPLDRHIQQRYGVQLIAPHKFVRTAPATQDGQVRTVSAQRTLRIPKRLRSLAQDV